MSRYYRPQYRTRIFRYDPRIVPVGVIVIVLCELLIFGAAFIWGGHSASNSTGACFASVVPTVAHLNPETSQDLSSQELANLRRGAEIDQKAAEQLRSEMAGASAKIVRLRRENAIYQSLLDSSIRTRGLTVYSLELKRLVAPAAYEFRITLLQRNASPKRISGSVNFEIKGVVAGVTKQLSSKDLHIGSDGRGQLNIDLLYFQTLEGQFQLPAMFEPKQVRINAKLNGRPSQNLTQTMDWVLQE